MSKLLEALEKDDKAVAYWINFKRRCDFATTYELDEMMVHAEDFMQDAFQERPLTDWRLSELSVNAIHAFRAAMILGSAAVQGAIEVQLERRRDADAAKKNRT